MDKDVKKSIDARAGSLEEILQDYSHLEGNWRALIQEYCKKGLVDLHVLRTILLNMEVMADAPDRLAYDFTKRLFDITVALAVLLVSIPLLLCVSVAIKLNSSGPIFYKDVRLGQYFRPFYIFKFRTMVPGSVRKISFMGEDNKSQPLMRLKNDPRVTAVGKFLRKWSLDELPQIINVLRGEMTLVGPRPLNPDDSATTVRKYALRFAAKPGMTGLWQTLVRSTNNGLLKIRLDCDYVRRRGFFLDLYLLVKTVPVLLRTGFGIQDSQTTEKALERYLDQVEQISMHRKPTAAEVPAGDEHEKAS